MNKKIIRVSYMIVITLLVAASFSQAASSDPNAPKQTPSDPNAQNTHAVAFDDVLKIWISGQKEQSLKSFLTIDWSRPDIFAADSIFRISEAQFSKLPEAKRAQIQQQAMDASKNIRELAKFAVEQARQSGEQDKYRDALLICANRLSANDQLALIQLVAKAVKIYAERALATAR